MVFSSLLATVNEIQAELLSSPMTATIVFLAVLLGGVGIWFGLLKRPVYEAMLVSFALLLTVMGKWGSVLAYIDDAMSTNLLYTMVAFVAMSILMSKTKVIDGCIAIILSLLGRIPGGAGYVSVIAAAFMGALSGSGPGNIMATGAITIPAMKKTGFPPELAGNIASNASYMGNMIPPSTNVLLALGILQGIYQARGMEITQGQFWLVLWGISIWFILQRMIMVFIFCRRYKVKPIPKEELPRFGESLKKNWKGLLLPVVILLPFLLEFLFSDKIALRLGAAGAKSFSSSLLLFIPGVTAMFIWLITKNKKAVTPNKMAKMFADGVKSIAPAIGVCIIGYMLGGLFDDLNLSEGIKAFVESVNFGQNPVFGRLGMAIFVSLFTCFLGMVVPGSALVKMIGLPLVAALEVVGVDPLLAAAMLPCICGVMCGITPPLGLGVYAGMTLSGAEFGKTVKNNMWWVAAQFVLQVVVLMGWLPIIGMPNFGY